MQRIKRPVQFVGIVLAVFLFLTGSLSGTNIPVQAQAGPADYDWDSTSISFYNQWALTYEFSNLDLDFTYVWTVSRLNLDGSTLDDLGSLSSQGVASATLGFAPDLWPSDWTGPMVVRDNIGQTLNYHFIAPSPDIEWTDTAGNSPLDKKVVAGIANSEGNCRAPVYDEVTADGWHHTGIPCSVQVGDGTISLLHYRQDPATTGADADKIVFSRIPDLDDVITLEVDELVDYNFDGFSSGISTINTNSFIVLNPTNRILPFTSFTRSLNTFTVGDDPTLLNIPFGAYSCVRNDSADAWINDCESVWLYGSQPPNTLPFSQVGDTTSQPRNTDLLNEEWQTIVASDPADSGGIQNVTFRQKTREIWDGYSGEYLILDTQASFTDTTLYAFLRSRQDSYGLPQVDEDTVSVVLWQIEPRELRTQQSTPLEMAFTTSDFYIISSSPQSVSLGLTELINRLGLDTDLGRALVFVTIGILAQFAIGMLFGPNFLAALVTYEFTGVATFFLVGMSPLIFMLFVVSSFLAWMVFFAQSSSDNSASV